MELRPKLQVQRGAPLHGGRPGRWQRCPCARPELWACPAGAALSCPCRRRRLAPTEMQAQEAYASLLDRLNNTVELGHNNSLLLVGPRGCGKTLVRGIPRRWALVHGSALAATPRILPSDPSPTRRRLLLLARLPPNPRRWRSARWRRWRGGGTRTLQTRLWGSSACRGWRTPRSGRHSRRLPASCARERPPPEPSWRTLCTWRLLPGVHAVRVSVAGGGAVCRGLTLGPPTRLPRIARSAFCYQFSKAASVGDNIEFLRGMLGALAR